MRLLVVSPFLPHAGATHGGGIVLAALVGALAREAETSVLSFADPTEAPHAEGLARVVARLVAVPRRRNEDLSALGRVANRARLAPRIALRGLPFLAAKFRSAAFARALETLVREEAPAAVLFEYGITAQYLPLAGDRPTVLTDHEAGSDEGAAIPLPAVDRAKRRAFVRRLYPKASLLQALSAEDADLLRAELGAGAPAVEVRPPAIPLPVAPCRPGDAPPAAAFFGNWRHAPNAAAARFVAREVFPRVRSRIPAATLLLAGAEPPGEIASLSSDPGVRFEGFVPDLGAFLGRVRCVVAPVFSGAGVRIKVLDSLGRGVPVVTNALGARGLADAPSAALRRSETAEALAAAAAELLSDAAEATRAGAAARRWAESRADAAAVARAQVARVARLVETFRSRRG